MLIKGTDLDARQRSIVLARFQFRWTHEASRLFYGGRCAACSQRHEAGDPMTVETTSGAVPWHQYHVPLMTDDEWLRLHAFAFTRDGGRLDRRVHRCVPAYEADREEIR